jgi:hypothetical protein
MKGIEDLVFIGEIVLQSQIAQRAAERLMVGDEDRDHIETWCSIQSILGAVGNVSKILWPIKKKYEMRGERLRQLLKVENDNPLSDRNFRNNFFEHYDERVEEYFQNNRQGGYTDLAMNPHFNSGLFGYIPEYTHRGYNSFNNTLVFRDEILDLNELLLAVDNILNNCKPYSLMA